MIFAKQILKFKPMLCKYLRSSLKTVRRTVFPPDGVALSSNLSLTASQVKQKEQAEACSFCLAGVERFELPDDGVRVNPFPHSTSKIADNIYDFLSFWAYFPVIPRSKPDFYFFILRFISGLCLDKFNIM